MNKRMIPLIPGRTAPIGATVYYRPEFSDSLTWKAEVLGLPYRPSQYDVLRIKIVLLELIEGTTTQVARQILVGQTVDVRCFRLFIREAF